MKNLNISLSCLSLFVLLSFFKANGQTAEVKLEFHNIGKDTYSIHLLARSEQNRSFNLASQNYRLYYNSESVEFIDETLKSKLDDKMYTIANLIEHLNFSLPHTLRNANNIEHMGLLNFEVGLLQPDLGGVIITDRWEEMISFQIKVTADFRFTDLFLAQRSTTSKIATAYVELSEWIDAYSTLPINVNLEIVDNEVKAVKTNLEVGPNPTTDYISVVGKEMLKSVSVYNPKGVLLNTYNISGFAARIDLHAYIDGVYTIVIEHFDGYIDTHQIVKVHSVM